MDPAMRYAHSIRYDAWDPILRLMHDQGLFDIVRSELDTWMESQERSNVLLEHVGTDSLPIDEADLPTGMFAMAEAEVSARFNLGLKILTKSPPSISIQRVAYACLCSQGRIAVLREAASDCYKVYSCSCGIKHQGFSEHLDLKACLTELGTTCALFREYSIEQLNAAVGLSREPDESVYSGQGTTIQYS